MRVLPMLHCASPEILRQWIEALLPEAERLAWEQHFHVCPQCQGELKQLGDRPLPAESAAELRRSSVPHLGPAPPAIPDIELMEVVGRGGSGQVWKGRLRGTSQLVAVKVLTGGVHADGKQQERFLREVEILSRLQHPGLIRLFHFGVTPDGYYFSMEYLPAGSLIRERTRLATETWPIRRATELVLAVARAIQYAHEQHIIHRDLKPGNILLTDDGRPLVADFGIAKVMTGADTTGTSAGTPCYMAPEQASGQLVDGRADVYGLGAVLYSLVTGRPPVPPGESDADTVRRVIDPNTHPVAPRLLRPDVPADLDRVILKCLEKEVRHRYQSAATVADELDRVLAGKPVQVRPLSRPTRAWRWARRNPTVAGLTTALVAVVVAAMVTVTVLWRVAATEAVRANAEAANATRQRELVRETLLAQADALTKAYEHISLTTPAERERFGESIERILTLLSESDTEVELQHRTAVQLLRYGIILRRNLELEAAERLVRTAVGHLERLAAAQTNEKWIQCDYSDALTERADLLFKLGWRAEGLELCRRAETVAVAAAARWPDSDHAKGVLAARRTMLASSLIPSGSFDEIERLLVAASGPALELARKYPEDFTRHGLVQFVTRAYEHAVLSRIGDTNRFLARQAEWNAHVDWVRSRHPQSWAQLTQPWTLAQEETMVRYRLGNRADAIRSAERLLACCRASDAKDPDTSHRLAFFLFRVQSLLPENDPRRASFCDEAARLFDQLTAKSPSWDHLLEHAWFLCTCPVAAHRDGPRGVRLARQAVTLAAELAVNSTHASEVARARLATCLLANRELDAAEKELSQPFVTQTETALIGPLVTRASLEFQRGRPDAAKTHLAEAVQAARRDWHIDWLLLENLAAVAKQFDGTTPDLTPLQFRRK